MDEAERDRLIDQVLAQHREILVLARHEREAARVDGQDTTWLDEVISGLERADEYLRNIEVSRAIRKVVSDHGPGPYPDEDLAAFTGIDVATIKRVVADLRDEGLAWPG